MTENEVFEGIHKDCGALEMCNYKETGCGDCPIRNTLIEAEKALEEIQKYRAIGTVEEILNTFNTQQLKIASQHNELEEYRAIGTIEEFKALKEKQKYCLGYRSEDGIKNTQFD